jgi:hypothetical protein
VEVLAQMPTKTLVKHQFHGEMQVRFPLNPRRK